MSATSKLTGAIFASAVTLCSLPVFAESITLNATLRDFCTGYSGATPVPGCLTNPDFSNGPTGDARGAVQSSLGSDGKPVFTGLPSAVFTNAANFNQWYNDASGVNKAIATTLTLAETTPGSGIYSYQNSFYFPLDDLGWKNQGLIHNYHFTLELHTSFTYKTGQQFDFTGDDDVWVFINDKLVVDLGGIHGAENASVDLDSLGLTDGSTYDFDFFFAERHTTESNLKIETSITFDPNPAIPEPATLALFSLGVAGMWLTRRRKS